MKNAKIHSAPLKNIKQATQTWDWHLHSAQKCFMFHSCRGSGFRAEDSLSVSLGCFPNRINLKVFWIFRWYFSKKKHLSDRGSVLSSGSSYVWVSAVSEDTQVTSVHSDSCKLPRGFSLCSRWSEGLCTGSQWNKILRYKNSQCRKPLS